MNSDRKEILMKVIQLHSLFHSGEIPTLAEHEVNPGLPKESRENYLYFTLPVTINFQRSSPALWASALKTYQDPETQYLFFPEEVVKYDQRRIRKDLTKHKLALQPYKHTYIWTTIIKTLNKEYSNDPRLVVKEGEYDAGKILNNIQKIKKQLFPYLGGPKLSNYWLYILDYYTDMKLKNKNEISIIPDTHIIQSSFKLGLTNGNSSPLLVAEIWKELLLESDLSPIDLHPVLWNWSRNKFLPEV